MRLLPYRISTRGSKLGGLVVGLPVRSMQRLALGKPGWGVLLRQLSIALWSVAALDLRLWVKLVPGLQPLGLALS